MATLPRRAAGDRAVAEEPDILDEDELLEPGSPEESSAFAEKLAMLRARCEAANIEFIQQTNEEGDAYARLNIKAGKNTRTIAIFNERRAEAILAISFEQLNFISGYEAICCYEDRIIEVGLRGTRMAPSFLLQRLQSLRVGASGSGLQPMVIAPPESILGRPTIEIGPCSPEFTALGAGRASQVTLKLKGARSTQHDAALAELRSYADSVFFQIDMAYGSTFILERERRIRLSPPPRRPSEFQLAYPTAHYNDDAMSLYWYAKSARDMPLLRFLAFYQSIEFYFPRYSQTEARKRVGSILKNPTFRAHREDDLDRLISAIQMSRSGGLGSERAQLRAVVNECLNAEEVRSYLTANKEREDHFSGRGGKSRYHKIPLANRSADLRNDLADRIYDIRCKIVHTKNEHAEDEYPMILPFSDDADFLVNDIDLVEFVARSVLIFSSGEIN